MKTREVGFTITGVFVSLRSLFEIILSDIRNAGSGMPIGLSNFKTTTTGVSNYALPMFASSSKHRRLANRG